MEINNPELVPAWLTESSLLFVECGFTVVPLLRSPVFVPAPAREANAKPLSSGDPSPRSKCPKSRGLV